MRSPCSLYVYDPLPPSLTFEYQNQSVWNLVCVCVCARLREQTSEWEYVRTADLILNTFLKVVKFL
jgi:hypothetical protein